MSLASGSSARIGAVSGYDPYPREASEREEAAVLDEPSFELAGWWSRVGAYLLDGLILYAPLAAVVGILFASSPDDEGGAWAVLGLVYALGFVLPWAYFTVLHGGERGATYGKRALGIRVVDERHGGSIGYGSAFGRYAVVFGLGLFALPLVADYLWPLWDEKNQSLHDKAVRSLVVRA
jgi:uncharacterized RDD family membrane protein YckC